MHKELSSGIVQCNFLGIIKARIKVYLGVIFEKLFFFFFFYIHIVYYAYEFESTDPIR